MGVSESGVLPGQWFSVYQAGFLVCSMAKEQPQRQLSYKGVRRTGLLVPQIKGLRGDNRGGEGATAWLAMLA